MSGRRQDRNVRVAVDTVDDDGTFDSTGVVVRDAYARAALNLDTSLKLLDLDMYAAPFKDEPVGLFLDIRNLFGGKSAREFDIARCRISSERPRNGVYLQLVLEHCRKQML